MSHITTQIAKILGVVESSSVKDSEWIVSAVGGFIAIFGLLLVSQYFIDGNDSSILIASMGASAVLLFTVPHGQLSQPWAVFGGHILSAIVGVSCAKWIPNELLAASMAVGLAIGVMYYLRCIHPPGGATALAAVIGGEQIGNLGYLFVITPILINVCIILIIAVLYNYFFSWRRYPIALYYKQKNNKQAPMKITISKQGKET
jgi:CBS-domain-containing membrane protein